MGIKDIVKDIPLTKLVKQKVKPNRKLSGLEITLLILGFPLWFPLLLTFLVLCLVFYILVWVFVIVAYSVELSFVSGGIGSLIAFF